MEPYTIRREQSYQGRARRKGWAKTRESASQGEASPDSNPLGTLTVDVQPPTLRETTSLQLERSPVCGSPSSRTQGVIHILLLKHVNEYLRPFTHRLGQITGFKSKEKLKYSSVHDAARVVRVTEASRVRWASREVRRRRGL